MMFFRGGMIPLFVVVVKAGLYNTRGSQLRVIGRDRLIDVFNTRGEVSVLRLDPDTSFAWVGSPGFVNVFESRQIEQLSQVPVH